MESVGGHNADFPNPTERLPGPTFLVVTEDPLGVCRFFSPSRQVRAVPYCPYAPSFQVSLTRSCFGFFLDRTA